MNQREYEKAFGLVGEDVDGESGGNDKRTSKTEKALENALDIRKFEIGLYWQRATYFWALIAAAFAGYFAIVVAEDEANKGVFSYILANIGFIFTWAWFQANRGSKYWQENWENHVDMLENEITGPLYKTILDRPGEELKKYSSDYEPDTWIEKHVTNPLPISVSRVNQIISLYTLILWLMLLGYSITLVHYTRISLLLVVLVGMLTLTFYSILKTNSMRHSGDQHHFAVQRKAVIVGDGRPRIEKRKRRFLSKFRRTPS